MSLPHADSLLRSATVCCITGWNGCWYNCQEHHIYAAGAFSKSRSLMDQTGSIGYRNTRSVVLHGCYLFSYINIFCTHCWISILFKTNIQTLWDITETTKMSASNSGQRTGKFQITSFAFFLFVKDDIYIDHYSLMYGCNKIFIYIANIFAWKLYRKQTYYLQTGKWTMTEITNKIWDTTKHIYL